jgi:hypothetical protein
MNATALDQLVNTVLYEGFILYPYRPSSRKNSRERFTFGRVYPAAYSEAQRGAERCVIQTECLLRCLAPTLPVEVRVRFLQPTWREVGVVTSAQALSHDGAEPEYRAVPELVVGGKLYQSWQEAVERETKLPPFSLQAGQTAEAIQPFAFPASRTFEALSEDAEGRSVGVLVRRHELVQGLLEVKAIPVAPDCCKIRVRVLNQTPVPEGALEDQDAILLRTFASTHTILRTEGGEFISSTDPPDEQRELVEGCENVGTWPVLVGDADKSQRDTMLSSPIILYDYPKIAPETNGDFFDGTEIDEMLALRVTTLTDEEKREMGGPDGFARKILERTQGLSQDHWSKMHGTMRDMKAAEEFFNPVKPVEHACVDGVEVKAGAKVRLRPKSGADAFDLMLAGKTAIVEAVEQDAESRIHLAVVLEDDPGKDLGLMRQPGHRFFYGLDEIELLKEEAA